MHTAGTLARAISVALFGFAFATGCTVTARTHPVDVVAYDDPVPEDVYSSAPTTVYEGRTYVFYRDRWIYRHGNRWSYVRDEPYELHRRRPPVATAPPAHHPHGHGGGPPPQAYGH